MTYTEENYVKAIYYLSSQSATEVTTSAIANLTGCKAPTVTDMLQKLAEKGLLTYRKYRGVALTTEGRLSAVMVIRKHRLWEVFLVEKLGFSWDEVSEVAEQLEHIRNEKLTDSLESYLGFPTEDPHGDPIPDRNGNISFIHKRLLSEMAAGTTVICVGVRDSSPAFLQYLDKLQISLGAIIELVGIEQYDMSFSLLVAGVEIAVSNKMAQNLFVKEYVNLSGIVSR